MDTIGNITVPEIAPSGTFPLAPDWPYSVSDSREIVIHRFGSANAKIEQRFYNGTGARVWHIEKPNLTLAERDALRDFWEARNGSYQPFTFNGPLETVTAIFANEPASWQLLADLTCSVGVNLVEVTSSAPTYTLNTTVQRFPSSTLNTALQSQVQEIIPLVRIVAKEPGYPEIFVSDRRCTVGSQLYLARLLEMPEEISQTIGNASDQANFRFGNADRVMRDLANDVDLIRASIEFSLFHVGTGIKLDLWKGEIIDWQFDEGPEFTVMAADGIYELTLPYPPRKNSRSCWKPYDTTPACPYSSVGALDITHFPAADASFCDLGYDTSNGCLAHGMKKYFGGVQVDPQGVYIKDNSTGVFGFSRASITSTSIVSNSIFDQVVPQVYTNVNIPVPCKIAAGRDESDYYEALGIVSEGPLGGFGVGSKLDGQLHHGYPGSFGLRQLLGTDPAGNTDFFSLDQSGNQTGGDYRKVYSGASTYKDNYAAGIAAIVIRRRDEKGLQLTTTEQHAMSAIVSQGMSGWVWSAPGSRSSQLLTNAVWIIVNARLRARGLQTAAAAVQELHFDVASAVATAVKCDTIVTSLLYGTSETQFKFCGIIQEEKPLRDWIQEIANNALLYTIERFGKVAFGMRDNATAVDAFTTGNMVWNSLQLSAAKPAFNFLTLNFGDEEFEFAGNYVEIKDASHAKYIGSAAAPMYLKSNMNLVGTSTKSQAGRLGTVRLREELGGVDLTEWKKCRQGTFKSTILALTCEPGMVVSITHPDVPGGVANFRVLGWKLNKDLSVDIQVRRVVASMYDLTVSGAGFVDVPASPVPVELFPAPRGPAWHPHAVQPSVLDAIYQDQDWSFGLQVTYERRADTTVSVPLLITGALPRNAAIPSIVPPTISLIERSGSGSLPAGSYSCAIVARDTTGRASPLSNIVSLAVTANSKITLSGLTWPAGTWDGYEVHAAKDDARLLCLQQQIAGSLPTSIDITNPVGRSTIGAPLSAIRKVRIKEKIVRHSGVWALQVSAVGSGTLEFASQTWSSDSWATYRCSVLYKADLSEIPMVNFGVAGNTADTLTGVVPDPVTIGIAAGDLIVMRSVAYFSGLTVQDPKWLNPSSGAGGGLTVNAEAGSMIHIIGGAGRGQARLIASNTNDTLTIDRAWDVMPDYTSMYVIAEPSWLQNSVDSGEFENLLPQRDVVLRARVDNFEEKVLLVAGFTVDANAIESGEDVAPLRECYIPGEALLGMPPQPQVTITSDTTLPAQSMLIRIDCSSHDVTATTPAAVDMVGIEQTYKRIDGSSYTCTVHSGDLIDGQPDVTLPDQWDSVTIKGSV